MSKEFFNTYDDLTTKDKTNVKKPENKEIDIESFRVPFNSFKRRTGNKEHHVITLNKSQANIDFEDGYLTAGDIIEDYGHYLLGRIIESSYRIGKKGEEKFFEKEKFKIRRLKNNKSFLADCLESPKACTFTKDSACRLLSPTESGIVKRGEMELTLENIDDLDPNEINYVYQRKVISSDLFNMLKDKYHKTELWKIKRELVLHRDGYKCQSCLSSPAEQVHHLTYQCLYDEPLYQLLSVCEPCHRIISLKDKGLGSGQMIAHNPVDEQDLTGPSDTDIFFDDSADAPIEDY